MMLQRIIRILLKTHICFGTSKSTIPRIVYQLKLRIFYFHPQSDNYYKELNYQHNKAHITMNNKKSFREILMPERFIRILLKTHFLFGTANSMISRNVH
jgi:hypothetical protein